MRTRRAAPPPVENVAAAVAAAAPVGGGAPPSETQRRILDAALALFAERGFEGVSTAQIAARAEVAEKTLFANFGSKQRLYEATIGPAGLKLILFPEAVRTLLPVFERVEAGPEALLKALAENRIKFLREHVREVRLILQHLVRQPESWRVIGDLWNERLKPLAAPLLEGMVRAGTLRDDLPPSTVVRMVVAQIIAYALGRVLFRPDLPWDDEREIARIVDVLLHGLAPRPAPGAPRATRRAKPR